MIKLFSFTAFQRFYIFSLYVIVYKVCTEMMPFKRRKNAYNFWFRRVFEMRVSEICIQLGNQSAQTHSNNWSAFADEFFECVWPFCAILSLYGRIRVSENLYSCMFYTVSGLVDMNFTPESVSFTEQSDLSFPLTFCSLRSCSHFREMLKKQFRF